MFYAINTPATRYQVRFYDNSYFEKLPTVSSAFKWSVYKLPGQQIASEKQVYIFLFRRQVLKQQWLR